MADFYKVLKADPLGDPWTPSAPDAKPIQNYWCQVEGQEWAVSIGKQVGNTIKAGEHIYGDLTYAKSQKGTEYWKFKSQKVPDDVTRPADTPAQATAQQATGQQPTNMSATMPDWFVPINNMILYIYKELRKMDEDAPENNKLEAKMPVSTVDKEIIEGATPVDEETKAQLDGLFGEPEVTPPEEK